MDVEAILNQIHERVVSEQNGVNDTRLSAAGPATNGSAYAVNHEDAWRRVGTNLAVAGRAADRLPPVFSKRDAARARLELWIKKKSKSLTRWFTWEQINFNRAVTEALGDVVEILKDEAHELATLRAHLTQELSRLRLSSEAQERERQNIRSETEARIQSLTIENAELTSRYSQLAAKHTKLADQVIDLAAQLRAEGQETRSQQDREFDRRLSELAAALKEEQRVCFRQISLETSEAAVLEDRARRALLVRLEQLEEVLKTGKT